MRAIILSASTGGGHMSAANTLCEYLISRGLPATVVDALEYISPLLNKTVTETYEYLATKQPAIWKMVYNSSNKKTLNKLVLSINSIISKKLLPLLEKYEPSVIITTHPFTTEMISKLKNDKIINTPLMCVMTDYAPHRTWINSAVDAYVVANEEMIEPMVSMDIDPNIIHPFGIPVDDSFFMKRDKNKILEELGLEPKTPTVLIMGGGYGFGNVEQIYKELLEIDLDFQIIIITGKNQKLYKNLKSIVSGIKIPKIKTLSKLSDYTSSLKPIKFIKKIKTSLKPPPLNIKKKKTKIIYYTHEVDKYMSAADLIITKPGGLTVSEALACNLPMALFNAIPGQEEENADFLVNKNMGVKLGDNKQRAKTITDLLKDPSKLKTMKSYCKTFDKSDSLKNTFDLLKKLV